MNSIIKKLFFLIALISLTIGVTSPALAASDWVGLNFNVVNATKYDQTLKVEENTEPFETHLVTNSSVKVNDSNWVYTTVDKESLKKGVLLAPAGKDGMAYKIGRVHYAYYSQGHRYGTDLKFKIISTKPGKLERICNIGITTKSEGTTLGNNYAAVTLKPDNEAKNQGICEVTLSEDNDFLDCGVIYCFHREGRDKYTVNIKVLPDTNFYEDNTIPCEPKVEVTYDDKTRKTSDSYDPVCKDGTLKINLPQNWAYKKMLFTFKKPSYGKSTEQRYTIDVGPSLISTWPTPWEIDDVNAKNTCYKTGVAQYERKNNLNNQTFINQCEVEILGHKLRDGYDSIYTGAKKDSFIIIHNIGPDAMWLDVNPKR